MHRKEFIKSCGFACLAGTGAASLLQGCFVAKTEGGKIVGDDLVVSVNDFKSGKGEKISYKKYIIIQQDILQYPICIYRFTATEYAALWMRCTHQGTELQVFGDTLQCPAHGSEFTSKGMVQNGPADMKLRTFPVTIDGTQIKISLKAV